MKISFPNDCDNAPKRKVIKDFIVAFYKNKSNEIENLLEDRFEFDIIGEIKIKEKETLKKYSSNFLKTTELKINEILSHGKFGACNGEVIIDKQKIDFAYFFEFKSAGKNVFVKISEYKIENKKHKSLASS